MSSLSSVVSPLPPRQRRLGRGAKAAGFGLLVLLAACGTPQEQCISRGTRDLQVVDRLIAESEATLARGYAIEEVETLQWRWEVCGYDVVETPKGTVTVPDRCMVQVPTYSNRAVSVDLKAEKDKLGSMKRKRQELAKAAEPLIQQCRAKYPE